MKDKTSSGTKSYIKTRKPIVATYGRRILEQCIFKFRDFEDSKISSEQIVMGNDVHFRF